ncbi:GNAT family N-acetyltransferase [Corynebacterium atypicum]|uniref:GNAT family N-acetyltransferase n=1 Tax=Corynebacterium atypicum TaxID=191610 RepID=UPI00056E4D98|nr:GNAT family N-acetyltransferase [Corynebacterium atypicum]
MCNYFAVSTLRELSSLELHQLYKLRVDVFVHEQGTAYAEIDNVDALDSTLHVLAWTQDSATSTPQLVGCARVYPADDGTIRLGRLAVAKQHRGTGLGTQILLQALRLIQERFAAGATIHAQAHLAEFYASFGFTAAGEQFEDTGISHLPMQISAADITELLAGRQMLAA